MKLKNFFIVSLFLLSNSYFLNILTACRVVTVHLFDDNNSSSGECLVDLESESDVKDALQKTRQCMGKRYIEGTSPSICFISSIFCLTKTISCIL
jgi:hypothetical protein